MRVCRFYTDVDAWSTLMPEDADQEIFDLAKTKKRLKHWKSPTVRVSAVARAKHGDFRDLHQAQWAVTPRAAGVLQSWFDAAGELLPLRVDDGSELLWFNCTRVVDALDHEASEIDFDEVVSYAFKAQALAGVGLFRLPAIMKVDPTNPDTWVFSYYQFVVDSDDSAAGGFATTLRTHKLKGLELREVWSDE